MNRPTTGRAFNATLRDYGRFALLHLGQGEIDGRRVVPSAWIEEISSGKSWPLGDDYETLPRGAYHNQFWIDDTTRRAHMARGVFGQLIYIDTNADFAALVLSSWPEFLSVERARDPCCCTRNSQCIGKLAPLAD